jgi:deoxyadenosine/deoxycytidine kinase
LAHQVILIAGNICAGKTKFVEYLRKNSFRIAETAQKEEDKKIEIVPEFIDPIALEIFYHDRKAHSEWFEVSCLMGRIVRHQKARYEPGIHLFDRGMIEGAETFCKNSVKEGCLSHDAYETYLKLLKRGLDQLDRTQPDAWLEKLIVYLRIEELKVLQERQRQRQTKGEIIGLKYLQSINERYEDFFKNLKSIYWNYGVRPPEVLTIDATVDFKEDKNYHPRTLEMMVQKIKEVNLKEMNPDAETRR